LSFNDQKKFLQAIHPFCDLDEYELEKVISSVEIGFYPKESEVIALDVKPTILYLIIKGEVKAYDSAGEMLRVYHAKEGFDADALVKGCSEARYEVTEDLICYELSHKGFMNAFENNEAFKQFYLMDMVERISFLKQKETYSDLSAFMVARVENSYLHEPCVVASETLVAQALRKSVEMKSSSIVVQDGDRYGIVTDSDIKIALSKETLDLSSSIGEMARYPIISVEKGDFLFNVYLSLIQKNIKRVAVTEEGKIIGMLEQIDILSYFANHSRLVTVKIEKAKTIEGLQEASQDYISIVKKLHAQGVKARYIAKLISEINRKVVARLFEMIVPETLRDDCALIIMGSEGRGEQIIRTDQDNGLIVREGVDVAPYYPLMQKFTKQLIAFGYPSCDGNIMVSNPYWCKSESAYIQEIEHWINTPDMDSYMHFSIFFDAQCMAGDTLLLAGLKARVFAEVARDNDIYMARFAKLTTLFETPVGFFSTFLHRDRKINLKKAGIFPIVQGIRSLCLSYKIEAFSTIERIKKLYAREILDEMMVQELREAFEVLLYIRLEQQLEELRQGNPVNNEIDTERLSKIQRDLLKDSLQIVEQFKKFITRHYRLENL
jgi:CBS domain-containing protein